jgi:elongator complex protein 4
MLPGTRAWISGGSLVSTGSASLDSFLGGGVPLGSVVVVEEDSGKAALARTIASLFVAQSGPSAQSVAVCSPRRADLDRFLCGVPRVAAKAEAAADRPAAELKVAWQYRQFVEAGGDRGPSHGGRVAVSSFSRSGSAGGGGSAPFCSSFDLDKPMGSVEAFSDAYPLSELSVSLNTVVGSDADGSEASASASGPSRVRRLAFLGLGSRAPATGRGKDGIAASRQFLEELRAIRSFVKRHSSTTVALVTLPSPHQLRALVGGTAALKALRYGDVVLQVGAFGSECGGGASLAAPPEFAEEYHGLLKIARLALPPSMVPASVRGGTSTLLFRKGRRKITLEPLHLPPEGETARPRDATAASTW